MFKRLNLQTSVMAAMGFLMVATTGLLFGLLLASLHDVGENHRTQIQDFSAGIIDNQQKTMKDLHRTIGRDIVDEVEAITKQQREDGLAGLRERGRDVADLVADIVAPYLANHDDTWVDETCRAASVDQDIGVIVVNDDRGAYSGGFYFEKHPGLRARLPTLDTRDYHPPDKILQALTTDATIADSIVIHRSTVRDPRDGTRVIGETAVLLFDDRLVREGHDLTRRAERLRERTDDSLTRSALELFNRQTEAIDVLRGTMDRDNRQKTVRARNWALGMGLAALAVALLAAAFLTTRLLTPLRHATRFASRLGAGDLSHRLPPGEQPDARELILALNAMADALQARIRDIDRSVAELHHAFAHAQDAAVHLDGGAGEIAASSGRFIDGAGQLQDALARIAAIMEQMGRHALGNARNITDVTGMSDAARAGAEHGAEEMRTLLAALAEVGEAYGRLASMMKTIDEIAFRTNLLSLNASIEAARAGRHGRGFSVVAEEVRGLALQSSKTATDVRREMEAAETRMAAAHQLAETTARDLAEIAAASSRVAASLNGVRTASNEQSEGVNAVGGDLERIADVARANRDEAHRIGETVAMLSETARELRLLVTRHEKEEAAPDGSHTSLAAPSTLTLSLSAAPASRPPVRRD